MTSLTDKQIYVVGPLKAQNQLLASHLEEQTGAKCLAVKNLRDLQTTDSEDGRHPSLALWDCFGRDREWCLSELDSDGSRVLARDYLALFNLVRWLGVEKEATARGARGFFYLEERLEQFKKGIHAIFNGEMWAPRKVMSDCIIKSMNPDRLSKRAAYLLSSREVEILQMVAGGYSNLRIAEELCISPHTVRTHIYNIYKKIKVPSRIQAALWAVKNL